MEVVGGLLDEEELFLVAHDLGQRLRFLGVAQDLAGLEGVPVHGVVAEAVQDVHVAVEIEADAWVVWKHPVAQGFPDTHHLAPVIQLEASGARPVVLRADELEGEVLLGPVEAHGFDDLEKALFELLLLLKGHNADVAVSEVLVVAVGGLAVNEGG